MESSLIVEPKSNPGPEGPTLVPISWSSLHYKSLVIRHMKVISESECWRNTDWPLGCAAGNHHNVCFFGNFSVPGIVLSWKGHEDKQDTMCPPETHNPAEKIEKQEHVIQSLKSFNRIWWLCSLHFFGFKDDLELLQMKMDFIRAKLWKKTKTEYWKRQRYSGVSESTETWGLHAVKNYFSISSNCILLFLFLCWPSSASLAESSVAFSCWRDYLYFFLIPSLKVLGRLLLIHLDCVPTSD